MSDDYRDHRGPYTPPAEPPLTFDARRPVRGGGGPAPIALIVSALVLVAVIGGAVFLYRGGLRGPNDAPRPVGEPVRDVKTAPPPEAQPVDPAAGLSVYKDNGPPAPPKFVPPPEQPGVRPAPAPVTAAPLAAAAAAKPTVVALAPPAAEVAPKPVAKPATAAQSPAKPAPQAAVTTGVATHTGVASVQIGAFSSAVLADKGWNEAARVAPGVMAGKGKKVEMVDVGGSTLYRTAITGFPSREAAQGLCDQLKAAGKTCFVK